MTAMIDGLSGEVDDLQIVNLEYFVTACIPKADTYRITA